MLAGCATQPPQRFATKSSSVDPRYGVKPSPRVVADGEPVPKGGGSNMVGKPYTIGGRTYYPSERPRSETGLASWYGSDFHGRRTANGEVFDRMSISAAHPTMPLPSYARVTNLRNQHSMIVRVNDRGPYHEGRIMDVSERVADALGFYRHGTSRVRVDFVGRASLAGSDDNKLLATLRTDGLPAGLGGGAPPPTMVAQAPITPEPRRERTEPRPERPRAQPVRVATAAPMQADDDDDAPEAKPTPVRAPASPRPPSRPVDLATIPGAGVPIGAPRLAATANKPQTIAALLAETTPMPPRR